MHDKFKGNINILCWNREPSAICMYACMYACIYMDPKIEDYHTFCYWLKDFLIGQQCVSSKILQDVFEFFFCIPIRSIWRICACVCGHKISDNEVRIQLEFANNLCLAFICRIKAPIPWTQIHNYGVQAHKGFILLWTTQASGTMYTKHSINLGRLFLLQTEFFPILRICKGFFLFYL